MPSESRLSIVGIGPGNPGSMTLRARRMIKDADFVVGYRRYLDLIQPLLKDKRVYPGRMGGEVERARLAVELLDDGSVALISSGDPNVYGMASLALEIALTSVDPSRIEVVPGVTAFSAAACRAGVVFRDSLAVVSLSDLLTPWEDIWRRVRLAASMGMPLALYNPRSSRRDWQLSEALEILKNAGRGGRTVVVARNVSRKGESIRRSTVDEMLHDAGEIDMLTLLIIGGEQGHVSDGGISIAGVGPGSIENLTHEVVEKVRSATLVLGAEMHLECIKEIIAGEVFTGAGSREDRQVQRLERAVCELENGGLPVITVGGDPSIFSAAGRYIGMGRSLGMLPGVSAFSAAAARAGAPISNDFALLSGSVPPEKLSALADAGFSMFLYNASAYTIKSISDWLPGSRPCAVARDVTRRDEILEVCRASELGDLRLDGSRYTLVVSGPGSRIRDGMIVASRGYEKKYCV
ncbi:SAM-dependent methyltransferase [Methanothrix thermoacetophila]|uniref:Precorrin-3 methyltransferase n=1 Tax=Methanothrix thermoacetophila (strain DSM 6194 / JCM 14653 / NBRC 101360 / PT) TaxID=349307 RepID=A0B5H0_METTP|nr:SAM-dependent methyltransferase [Methanothrix thermoacetophila]ABK13944.1 precorrin-3 methyltransferase [Methanothrix thermoacetophila PT]